MPFLNFLLESNEDMTEKHFFAEPTSLDISWGKELKDFSMGETWNLIPSWEKLREDLCHISPFEGQGERAQEP